MGFLDLLVTDSYIFLKSYFYGAPTVCQAFWPASSPRRKEIKMLPWLMTHEVLAKLELKPRLQESPILPWLSYKQFPDYFMGLRALLKFVYL